MADKFLDKKDMEEIKEGIRMTRLGQMLVDMGIDEGISKGIDKANRLSHILLKEKRYEELERSTRDKEYQKQLFEKYSIL